MAAEAKSPEEKQNIYETYMLTAIYGISMQEEFNIDQYSSFMKKLHAYQVHEQGEVNNPDFYRKRVSDIGTPVLDLSYSDLSIIFMQKVEDIVSSDISSLFITNPAAVTHDIPGKNLPKIAATFNQYLSPTLFLNNVNASEIEKRFSQYVHTNINNAHRFRGTIKANRINHPSKPVRTKGAFKYSPNIAGIQLTDRFLNKYMYYKYGTRRNNSSYSSIRRAHEIAGNVNTRNASRLSNYRKLKNNIFRPVNIEPNTVLLQMYTTMPDTGIRIPTSGFGFHSIKDASGRVVNTLRFSVASLIVRHTAPEYVPILLTKVREFWRAINHTSTIEEIRDRSLAIHWLISTAAPFHRGSAGFAKIMLNAVRQKANFARQVENARRQQQVQANGMNVDILNLLDMPILKETPQYNRKSDWVALLSPTFKSYITDVNGEIRDMFEIDALATANFNNPEFKARLDTFLSGL